ncbi:1644_t:CDS:2 [Paraglomus brasilianum]|uniref:1644_t:CDS:1 n=1 Tax=Paraglomus brasilianum TaxID=144538 RepID=A0A9N8VNT6_9GLOM|nr:1644_t:CDS:2 [Paraglomus brasilianum]
MADKANGTNSHEIEYVERDEIYETKSEFLEKLFTYSVVKDAYIYVNNNKIGNAAINAVSTVGKITTAPVMSRFPEMSKNVDHFAAGGVALVGDTFPLTKASAGEIITGVTTPAKQTISSIQSTIDTKVTTPINHQARKIASQVCEQITPLARNVDKSLEPIINKYGGLVDSWLPAEESETEEEKSDSYQTYRAYSLTSKAQRRLSKRLKRQISNTQTFTASQLRQIQDSNNLLRQATETVATLNGKLNELVVTAKTNAVSLRDTVQNQDLGSTLQSLSKNLLTTTDSIAKYIKENTGQLPDYIQDSLTPMVTFFNEVYGDVMKEFPKDDANALQKAKYIVHVTSQHTLPVLQRSLTDLSASLDSYRTTFNGTLASTTEAARGYLAPNKTVGVN